MNKPSKSLSFICLLKTIQTTLTLQVLQNIDILISIYHSQESQLKYPMEKTLLLLLKFRYNKNVAKHMLPSTKYKQNSLRIHNYKNVIKPLK